MQEVCKCKEEVEKKQQGWEVFAEKWKCCTVKKAKGKTGEVGKKIASDDRAKMEIELDGKNEQELR